MSDASDLDPDPLVPLAESFLERLRRGERVGVSDYADRHPELADQIRDLFPPLVELERFHLREARPGRRSRPARLRVLRFLVG